MLSDETIKNKRWLFLTTGIAGLVGGLVIGYLLAAMTFKTEILVDFASGNKAKRMYIGPIMIRTETIVPGPFASIGGPSASHSQQYWRVVDTFWRGSDYSRGQSYLKAIPTMLRHLDCVIDDCERAEAQKIKTTFLQLLQERKFHEASKLVDATLDLVYARRTSFEKQHHEQEDTPLP
jgi:hypothetical protein